MRTLQIDDIVSVIMFGRTQVVQVKTVDLINETFDFVDPITGELTTISFNLIWNFVLQTRITEGLYEGCWGDPHYAKTITDAIEFATFTWRDHNEVRIMDTNGFTIWERNNALNCGCEDTCNNDCEIMNLEYSFALAGLTT